jgi:hypothetical protein
VGNNFYPLPTGCLVKNRGWTISAAGQKLRVLLRVIGMDILRKTVWYSVRRCFSVCDAHFALRRRGGASPTRAFPDLEPTLSQLGRSWHGGENSLLKSMALGYRAIKSGLNNYFSAWRSTSYMMGRILLGDGRHGPLKNMSVSGVRTKGAG